MLGDSGSRKENARTILDPCSEVSLIDFALARKLNCELQCIQIGITGVSGSVMDSARFLTHVNIFNPSQSDYCKTGAFVLRHIGISTPSEPTELDFSHIRRAVNLADPHFDEPGQVNVVLGADIYEKVMLPGLRQFGSLLAQQTIFGWTLTGKISVESESTTLTFNTHFTGTSENLDPCHEELVNVVQRFWAMEEIPQVKGISAADEECEEIYSRGYFRDEHGRYVVPLPLKASTIDLIGDSLPQARTVLTSTHRRMQRDPVLAARYRRFMEEYLQLGHMRLLSQDELSDRSRLVHYIPHHGIWQKGDDGCKLRVVSNASRPTSSGKSLNDILHTSQKLQSSIGTVITRWRRYRYVFCADIKMMFRQIRISEEYIHLQRILWSPSSELPVQHYVLLTVTYGTACAPYLAIRTLHQLCTDDGHKFPEAVDAIHRELYVDDFLSGGHDLESARRRRDQIVQLLMAGGFVLKEWVTNEVQLLDEISSSDRLRPEWLNFSSEGPVNELGVAWNPVSDQFTFRSTVINIVLVSRKEGL